MPLVNFFQTPLYGVKNYHVEIVANSESQVKDTFKVAYDMLHDNPKFKGKFSVTKELITNLATGSEMKYNTSNAKTKDGKRTGCLVLNEIHAYENYDQINVFESSFGKVKHSREFIITTDGYVRDGPLDEISAMCAEILETGENLLGYFPFICEIDDMKEVDDPEAWHKANPSMEYMPILANQIMHDYLEMKKIPSKRAEFITKRMDRSARKEEETVTTWQNVLRACYEGETMEELERKIPRITLDTRGQAAVIGIDYADVRDFASAGILTKTDDGEWIWRQHTWICADSPFIDSIKFPLRNVGQEEFEDFEVVQGPVIDVNIIADWCMKQFQDYDVKKIAKRVVDKLYLICNPSDEAEYVDPCMYGEALTGGYVNKSFIDIEKIVDANCPKGKAAFTIAGYYTMGTAGVRVDEYDQTKAIEDADLIVAKCHANGRAVDDNVAVVFDVTKLEEYVLPVNQVTVPKQA